MDFLQKTRVKRDIKSTAHSAEVKNEVNNINNKNKPLIKGVRFSLYQRIVLIPTTKEYKEEGLADQLWESFENLEGYKYEALTEVTFFFNQKKREGQSITLKEAMKELYQIGL